MAKKRRQRKPGEPVVHKLLNRDTGEVSDIRLIPDPPQSAKSRAAMQREQEVWFERRFGVKLDIAAEEGKGAIGGQ